MPCEARASAELLGEPDEKSSRSADVAEPIRVFVPDHFAADELRTVLAERGERIVDVVRPSSSRPSSRKKAIVAGRSSTTMPTLSIR